MITKPVTLDPADAQRILEAMQHAREHLSQLPSSRHPPQNPQHWPQGCAPCAADELGMAMRPLTKAAEHAAEPDLSELTEIEREAFSHFSVERMFVTRRSLPRTLMLARILQLAFKRALQRHQSRR